jgi:hypothetical protein
MSITAQAGFLELGLNVNGLKGGAVNQWYRYKTLAANVAPVIEKQVAPPEVGGANNPTGAYKSGAYFAGSISMQPRLKDDIGHALLWATGYAATPTVNATSGLSVHKFSQKPGSSIFLPFGGIRRYIPGISVDKDLGEIGKDVVVNAITFNFPQVGPLSVEMAVTGREFRLDSASDLWPTLVPENYDSVPMVMQGSGLILPNWAPGAGNPLPVTNAKVTIANNTTSVQEERIIGSYFPDDFATRQRTMSIEFTYKWANPELYRFIINNNAASDEFFPCIDKTDFRLTVETPCKVQSGTIDYPWKLELYASKVDWQASPLQLQGDDILSMQFSGTVLEADTGLTQDYFNIDLHNDRATQYALPVA